MEMAILVFAIYCVIRGNRNETEPDHRTGRAVEDATENNTYGYSGMGDY